MKKIIVIFALIIGCFTLGAQDQSIFKKGQAGISNTTADTIVLAYNYTFLLREMQSPYLYTYSVHLDDKTGANTATFVLSGSLDGINFKTIQTVSYTGAGSDTTIISNITSAPLSYKQLRFTITPSDTIWVKSMFLNVLPTDL